MSGAFAPRSGVRRLTETYQRFRQVIHEGAKFGIVGLTGLAVTNLVFIPLHDTLRLGPLTSLTGALAIATVVTFIGNRYWSFRDRAGAGTGREGLMFFFLNGIGLLIQYAVLGLSNYGFDLTTKLEDVFAVNAGIGIGTLFRFWSYRKWVWVPPDVNLARLRRGRHRMGRDLSAIPPGPRPMAAFEAPVPLAATVATGHPAQLRSAVRPAASGAETRPDLRVDDIRIGGLGDPITLDSLRRGPGAGASVRRRPRTPAAG